MNIKALIKKISTSIGIRTTATKVWFYLLSLKSQVNIKYYRNHILVRKKDKVVKISNADNGFGSLGIVVRDFDDFFRSVIPEKNNDDFVIDFTTPKFHNLTNGDSFFFHDICEPLSVVDIYIKKANVKLGDVVIDIGGYCGTQTVFYSRLVGENGKVIVFEPDEKSYASLMKNIEFHNCRNVIVKKMGVYSMDGELAFQNTGSMGSSVSLDSDSSSFKIKVCTLETIARELNLEKINFVKMDIEGSEIEVLSSSTDFINRFKPNFIIEPHYKNDILNDKEIITILGKLNYSTDYIKQGDFDYQPLLYAYPNN
jgi:FkbM family methyltransferase